MKKVYLHSVSAIALILFLLIAIGSSENGNVDSTSPASSQIESSPENSKKNPHDYVTSGKPLSTRYFDVTVNSVSIKDRVNTGNQFANLKNEDGIEYLIINTTFKNTSGESKMIVDGEVLIDYNDKEYKFDKSETIMLDGWGLMLDQINPLTAKTTNLVYKIPTEISGDAYYHPGRAGSNDLVYLGKVK